MDLPTYICKCNLASNVASLDSGMALNLDRYSLQLLESVFPASSVKVFSIEKAAFSTTYIDSSQKIRTLRKIKIFHCCCLTKFSK